MGARPQGEEMDLRTLETRLVPEKGMRASRPAPVDPRALEFVTEWSFRPDDAEATVSATT